jgi:hypothetical protein
MLDGDLDAEVGDYSRRLLTAVAAGIDVARSKHKNGSGCRRRVIMSKAENAETWQIAQKPA